MINGRGETDLLSILHLGCIMQMHFAIRMINSWFLCDVGLIKRRIKVGTLTALCTLTLLKPRVTQPTDVVSELMICSQIYRANRDYCGWLFFCLSFGEILFSIPAPILVGPKLQTKKKPATIGDQLMFSRISNQYQQPISCSKFSAVLIASLRLAMLSFW